MPANLDVAGLSVPAGERHVQVVQADLGDRQVDVPIIAVNGAQSGPRVTVTAGVHGAEYVGIEGARRLGTSLDPAEVQGSVVVVPVMNTTAFFTRSIYTSGLDNNNINREFPGDPNGEPAQRLAYWLFQNIIKPSDYFVDMHGGDMIEALVPFAIYLQTGNETVDETARQMADAYGIEIVIRGATPGSAYGAAAQAGIPAIIAEIGGQGVWDEALVTEHAEGARRVLRHLGVVPGGEPAPTQHRSLTEFPWLRSNHDGLLHPFVGLGDRVEKGQPVARVTDYFGRELEQHTAPETGEVLFLVTSLAINQGDPILAVGA